MKKISFSKSTIKKGFSLVELIMVFGLIGVAVAGSFVALSGASSSQKSSSEAQNISFLSSKIKSIYNRDYNGLTTQIGIDTKVFPDSMVNAAGTAVTNLWGGNVTLAAGSVNGGVDNAFALTYNDVPQDECVSLVKTTSQNMVEIDVNGATIKSNTLPLNIGTLSSAAGCANATNIIIWRG